MAAERLLEMGQTGKAHGIKGELALLWHGVSLPHTGQKLVLEDDKGNRKKFALLSLRMHKGIPLAILEGVSDRTAAERLKGQKIYLSSRDVPPLGEDEAWLADLVGMEVLLENGESLGRLDHVEFPAGQEIWSIIDANGREVLFPAQPRFLVNTDLNARTVTIRPPEGLLDIYNA